jgi:hypothetical protein
MAANHYWFKAKHNYFSDNNILSAFEICIIIQYIFRSTANYIMQK